MQSKNYLSKRFLHFIFTLCTIGTSSILAQSGRVGIGESSPGSKGSIKGNLSVGSNYSSQPAPTDGAIIEGKTGIGKTNPDEKLDVVGNVKASDKVIGTRGFVAGDITSDTTRAIFSTNITNKGFYVPRLTNSEASTLGTSLVAANNGLMIYNTTNNRLEFWHGPSLTWKPVGEGAGGPPTGTAGGDLTGSYPNPTIANSAVNSAKILDGSITGDDLATGAVDLGTNKVTGVLPVSKGGTGNSNLTAKRLIIGDGTNPVSVSNAAAPGQVLIGNSTNDPTFTTFTGDVINNASGVTTISNDAVTSAKILDGTITNADISNTAAIARTKIAGGTANHVVVNDASGNLSSVASVPVSNLPNLAGDVTGAINANTIANDAVTSAKILDGTITNADISNTAAIARTKIAGGTANHVVVNDASGNLSSVASVPVSNLPNLAGDVTGAINANTIANDAVISAKILDGTIADADLSNSGVTAGTYTKVTVNNKGRVTTATTLAAADLPAGSDNYIQNQNSTNQTADFRISGTGRANTSFTSPLYTAPASNDVNVTSPTGQNLNLNAASDLIANTNGTERFRLFTNGGARISNSQSGDDALKIDMTNGVAAGSRGILINNFPSNSNARAGIRIDMSNTSNSNGVEINNIGATAMNGININSAANGNGTGIRIGETTTLGTGVNIRGGSGIIYNALNPGSGTGLAIGGSTRPNVGVNAEASGTDAIGGTFIATNYTTGTGLIGGVYSSTLSLSSPKITGVFGYASSNSTDGADVQHGVYARSSRGGNSGTTRSYGLFSIAEGTNASNNGLHVGTRSDASVVNAGTGGAIAGQFNATANSGRHLAIAATGGADVYLGSTDADRPANFTGTNVTVGTGNTNTTFMHNARLSNQLIFRQTGAGSNTATIVAPSSITASYTMTLPAAQGASNTVLRNDGSGNLSWVTGGSLITASNGLNLSGSDVRLGGTLGAATDINQAGFDFRFQGSGSVGIGTIGAPANKLHVNGGIRAEDGLIANDGTAALPAFRFFNSTTMGMYRIAANHLGFSTNSAERMSINSTGQVTVNNLAGTGNRQVFVNSSGTLSVGRAVGEVMSFSSNIRQSNDDVTNNNVIAGDEGVTVQNLGFNFTINGTTYTQVTISPNGYVVFGNVAEATNDHLNTCLPTSMYSNPMICAYWDDLQTEDGTDDGGHIDFQTGGTVGGRVAVIQAEARLFSVDDDVNYQIHIHESGLITVRYYPDMASGATGQSATIGFQSAGGSSGKAYTISCDRQILNDNFEHDQGWSIYIPQSQ